MIVLRFSAGRGWRARVVQLATWSWASHVDIELEDGRLLGAVPGRGVCIRPPEPPASAGRVERYRAATPQAAVAVAATQLGKPYDWPGVLGYALRRDWQDHRAWFCSELIAWACVKAGTPLLRADRTWRITPRDLLLSPLLEPLDTTTTPLAPAGGGRGVAAPRTAGRGPA